MPIIDTRTLSIEGICMRAWIGVKIQCQKFLPVGISSVGFCSLESRCLSFELLHHCCKSLDGQVCMSCLHQVFADFSEPRRSHLWVDTSLQQGYQYRQLLAIQACSRPDSSESLLVSTGTNELGPKAVYCLSTCIEYLGDLESDVQCLSSFLDCGCIHRSRRSHGSCKYLLLRCARSLKINQVAASQIAGYGTSS